MNQPASSQTIRQYTKKQAWIQAARPNTLPLALASIVLGTACASLDTAIDGLVLGMAILTATLLQILSNLANDYGDADLGADTEARIGPQRMVSTGQISPEEMRKAMYLFAGLSLVSGLALLVLVQQRVGWLAFGVLLGAGLLAIGAAIKYTVSETNYGYKGLGDLAVFLFFGWLGVGGSYFLQAGTLEVDLLLPASGFGLLATAVLNVNNLRDMKTDREVGKNTIPVRLGLKGARWYHLALVYGGVLCLVLYVSFLSEGLWPLAIAALGCQFPIIIAKSVTRLSEPAELEPMLKKTAISATVATLIVSGILIYL